MLEVAAARDRIQVVQSTVRHYTELPGSHIFDYATSNSNGRLEKEVVVINLEYFYATAETDKNSKSTSEDLSYRTAQPK
jgi:hypothetical protein